MSKLTRAMMMGAAGVASGDKVYVDDVFSTYLYDGNNGSTQTITNGIDNTTKSLIWIKDRNSTPWHHLVDNVRSTFKPLASNSTDAEASSSDVSSFDANGFTIGSNNNGQINGSSNYVAWNFRATPGFFDVVTYTGNGTSQTISHNLGSVPGAIIVKATDNTTSWIVHHRSLGASQVLELDVTNAAATRNDFANTLPTASVFSVSNSSNTNNLNTNYVAYLFAHDEQSFGTNGDEAIIKCGSYTGASAPNAVNVGFEPQFVIVKRTDDTNNWVIHDAMRGAPEELNANDPNPEVTENGFKFTSTGFELTDASGQFNTNGGSYIYVAIRRPHKPPEAATDVFAIDLYSGSTTTAFEADFPPDLAFIKIKNALGDWFWVDRFRGTNALSSNNVNADAFASAYNVQFRGAFSDSWTDYIGWMFRRAPGFMDVVAYTGTGVARTVNHNLGVKPELMIVKRRNLTESWAVYAEPLTATDRLRLNQTGAKSALSTYWNDTEPTSSVFTVGTDTATNASASTYIAYLFATLDGISKVGTYTGTGAAQNIDCGFTAGARFVLIKRADATGDWYVWDTTRGIVSGNDPYLLINSTDAEVTTTDYIDPLNAGFTVTSSAPAALNASGGSYIFFAIA